MDNTTLHKEYLRQGTAGYAVIRRFYSRYADVLATSGAITIDDVIHDVFISLSKTDFAKVNNADHYLLRAIKLHCWSMLDKAIRMKAVMATSAISDEDDERSSDRANQPIHRTEHHSPLEGVELLAKINLFKAQLAPSDTQLLNLLIDETPRAEIATLLRLKMNTLDTNIRRLRIRLSNFLKEMGYSYEVLERFQ